MEKVRHMVCVTDLGPYSALETREINVAQCHTLITRLEIVLKSNMFRWPNSLHNGRSHPISPSIAVPFPVHREKHIWKSDMLSLLCARWQNGASPQPPACQEINYACLQGHKKKSYAFPAVHSFSKILGSPEVVIRTPYSHITPWSVPRASHPGGQGILAMSYTGNCFPRPQLSVCYQVILP